MQNRQMPSSVDNMQITHSQDINTSIPYMQIYMTKAEADSRWHTADRTREYN